MHSFHPSRGRIFFEVLCALVLAASCAAAWRQIGASALLAAAAVLLLYAVVHMFDMRRPMPARVAAPEPVEVATVVKDTPPQAEVPVIEFDPAPSVESPREEVEPADEATLRTGSGRRKGGSRKSNGRRASVTKGAKPSAPTPIVVPEVATLAPLGPTEVAAEASLEDLDVSEVASIDETARAPLAPLFEPEPFARQHRTVFGRKAG